MHRSVVAVTMAVFWGWSALAQERAPINKFADVAGQWTGHASTHTVSLNIDPAGTFIAHSALGSERGQAKLEAGSLIVPLVDHDGSLQLMLQGNALIGFGIMKGTVWNVSLLRADPAVRKE